MFFFVPVIQVHNDEELVAVFFFVLMIQAHDDEKFGSLSSCFFLFWSLKFNGCFICFLVLVKKCFILFCGFCSFGICKLQKNQGLLENKNMPQLN